MHKTLVIHSHCAKVHSLCRNVPLCVTRMTNTGPSLTQMFVFLRVKVLSKGAEPTTGQATSSNPAGPSSLARERENVDELLFSILGPSKDSSQSPGSF